MRTGNWLVRLLGTRNALVDGPAAGESFFSAVPVSDGVFTHPPAEQHDVAFNFAGKIEQADVEILHLHANGVDFGERIFGALFSLVALGLAARDRDHVDVSATVQENAVIERLHFGFDFFHDLLAADGGAQKRFEHRKQSLSFVKSEGSVGHGDVSIVAHTGSGSFRYPPMCTMVLEAGTKSGSPM